MSDDPNAELQRLRGLVGPDERAYADVVADAARSEAAARAAEREVGKLRGAIAEMQVQLVRARQDQERYQRLLDARRGVVEGLARIKRRVVGRRT